MFDRCLRGLTQTFISIIVMNLVTPKVGAKLELLFKKLAFSFYIELTLFLADRKFVDELMNIKNVDNYPLEVPIKAELRSYQREGINWCRCY